MNMSPIWRFVYSTKSLTLLIAYSQPAPEVWPPPLPSRAMTLIFSQETSLGWNGLALFRSALQADTISSITGSWVWPDPILHLQSQISGLLVTLGRGPGSLFEEVIADSEKAVECEWDAHVRLGEDLPIAERGFLRERRRCIRKSFAKLIDVSENEIDERDIPVVAIAGSGGGSSFISRVRTVTNSRAGYRAMTNTIGSLVGARESGILDCTTYIAGISGSCWALGVLYAGVAGHQNPVPETAAEHIKSRIATNFLDSSTLNLLTKSPTHKVCNIIFQCTEVFTRPSVLALGPITES